MIDYFSYWHLRTSERHLLYVGSSKGGDSSPVDAAVLGHVNSSSRYLSNHLLNSIWSLFKVALVANTTAKSLPMLGVGITSLLDLENARSIFSTDPSVVCEKCYENTRALSGVLFTKTSLGQHVLSFLNPLEYINPFAPFAPFSKLYEEVTRVPHPTTPFFVSLGKCLSSVVNPIADLAASIFNVGPEKACAIGGSSVLQSRIFNFFNPFYTQKVKGYRYFNAVTAAAFLYKYAPSFIASQTAFVAAGGGTPIWHVLGTLYSIASLSWKITLVSKSYPLLTALGNIATNPASVFSSDPEVVCPAMRANVLDLTTATIRDKIGSWTFDPLRTFRVLIEKKPESVLERLTSSISSVMNPILSSIGDGVFYLADRLSFSWDGTIKTTCLSESAPNYAGRFVNFLGGYTRTYESLLPYQKYIAALATSYVLFTFISTQYHYFFDKEGGLAIDCLKQNFAKMTVALENLASGETESKEERFKGIHLKNLAYKIARSKQKMIEELDQLGLKQLDERTKNQLIDPLIEAAQKIIGVSAA